jgi:hypothetical protein
MPTQISWDGDDQVKRNMIRYGQQVREAELRVAQYWAAVIQTEARRRASWTDRTGNARQALRAYTSDDPPTKYGAGQHDYPTPTDLARDVVALYLSHGMEYGVHLETRYQGRYAIIMPTLERHYGEIARMLRGIFGR